MPEESSTDKKKLRQTLIAARARLTTAEKTEGSEAICRHLREWMSTRRIQKVALYKSFRDEPSLAPLEAQCPAHQLFYPRIDAARKSMRFRQALEFEVNSFGIEEPTEEGPLLYPDTQTLMLVPGLAFDRMGHRLGYGAGFYDRFLSGFPGITIGVCFEAFHLPALPRDDHDIPVKYIVSEAGLWTVQTDMRSAPLAEATQKR